MKLDRKFVEKPWGRDRLPPQFDAPADKRIGEVWFTSGADLPLLAKYIFTSERLSIQVHPKEKTECWLILDADPGATIGLGFRQKLSADELRAAALDGSIAQRLDWRPVRAGDVFLVPPGTVHAIGGGLSLLEFQQNCHITYRLYDYGRPRDLHLDEAVAVADPHPYPDSLAQHLDSGAERVLVEGPAFTLVHARADALTDRQRWIIPLEGAGFGDCFLLGARERHETDGVRILIGAAR
jgi:mannose-6-phosphate isomerase